MGIGCERGGAGRHGASGAGTDRAYAARPRRLQLVAARGARLSRRRGARTSGSTAVPGSASPAIARSFNRVYSSLVLGGGLACVLIAFLQERAPVADAWIVLAVLQALSQLVVTRLPGRAVVSPFFGVMVAALLLLGPADAVL